MVSNSLADLSLENLSALWETIVFDPPPQPIALIFPLQAHLKYADQYADRSHEYSDLPFGVASIPQSGKALT